MIAGPRSAMSHAATRIARLYDMSPLTQPSAGRASAGNEGGEC